MTSAFPFLSKIAPLKTKKNPALAAVIGFAFGSIGLGLYLRSLLDFVAPIVVIVLLAVAHQMTAGGWVVGALITGAYAFCRVVDSNARLSPQQSAAPSGAVAPGVAGNPS